MPNSQEHFAGGGTNHKQGADEGAPVAALDTLVNGVGNLARFVLLPGQRHDSIGVAPRLRGVEIRHCAGTATTMLAAASIVARRPAQNGSDSPGSSPQTTPPRPFRTRAVSLAFKVLTRL
jgi:hypothetical protein